MLIHIAAGKNLRIALTLEMNELIWIKSPEQRVIARGLGD